jgi:hypothetical protein
MKHLLVKYKFRFYEYSKYLCLKSAFHWTSFRVNSFLLKKVAIGFICTDSAFTKVNHMGLDFHKFS